MDPRDFDRMDRRMETDRSIGAATPWGWIAGAVVVIALLVLVFASGDGTRTARNDANPPGPTTSAPLTAPPATPPALQPPATTPPSTTGRGQ